MTRLESAKLVGTESFERRLLIDRLKTGKPKDMLTDEELGGIIGHRIATTGDGVGPGGTRGYHRLLSAIKGCGREYGVWWDRVPGRGHIQCAGSRESFDAVLRERKSRLKRARRAHVRAASVNPDDLDVSERAQYPAIMASGVAEIFLLRRDTPSKLLGASQSVRTPTKQALLSLFASADGVGG